MGAWRSINSRLAAMLPRTMPRPPVIGSHSRMRQAFNCITTCSLESPGVIHHLQLSMNLLRMTKVEVLLVVGQGPGAPTCTQIQEMEQKVNIVDHSRAGQQ